jgi:DNA-binding transcriptional LysR family regulator
MDTIKKATFDRFYSYNIILTVIREGSFVAASRRLNTTASNITKEIKKLEKHLGVILFHRTTRSIALTEEGVMAIEKFKNIIQLNNELEEDLKGNKFVSKGNLKVTVPTTLGQVLISKLIARFQVENPYIEIDLVLSDNVLDPIEHGIDLSVRSAYNLVDSSFFAQDIGQLERVICASPNYIEHFKKPTKITDLENHNCLLHMRGSSPYVWTVKKNNKELQISIQGSYKSNNLLSLVDACRTGIGILNCPKYLVEKDLKSGELVQLFKSWKLPSHHIYLITTMKPTQSKRLNNLVNFLKCNLI